MSKHTITHACGHQLEVALFGPHADRERRMAAMRAEDCPACRAAGSNLTGSVKQVAWATDIRAALAPRIIAAHDAAARPIAAAPERPEIEGFESARADILAALAAKRDALLDRKAARDWIDAKTDDGLLAYREIVRAGAAALMAKAR